MKVYTSFTNLREEISSGNTNCKQIVEGFLVKIEANKHLNAFVEVYTDYALAKAEAVDEKIKNGTAGKLAGMVIGIKDVLCLKGHAVTAASKILQGFESLFTATAIERLIAEDVIIIGRLNCDEFAMGSSNENSHYGNVLNAIDNTKVPGGSSGGSAVAVQAGLCHASLGTDTGGSIRQPASFCGIVGLKPTYGRISRWGLIAYASSFDQIGPFANTVEDVARLLEVMAGADEHDSTVSSKPVPNYLAAINNNTKPKVAYFNEVLTHNGLDEEIKTDLKNKINQLNNLGIETIGVDFPYLEYIVPAYYVLTTAEASSNLARFDGVHYGYRSPNATDMDSVYTLSRTEGFGQEVQRRIMLGTFVLSAGYYDAYYSKAQKVRRIIVEATRNILNAFDFILLPTTPTTAFGIGEKVEDPISMYLADIFTVQANLVGIPAISLPLGKHSNGLPYGYQLMADKFEEEKLLSFSNYLMKELA